MNPEASTRRAFSLDCIVDEYADRDAWLIGRQSLIGASDTAGIFGVGYSDQSPITIYDSKVNPPREVADPVKLKRFTVGKLMEPALRAIFTEETGIPCESPGPFTIHRHRDLPWLGCSLDAQTVHDDYGFCPIELKNVSNFNKADWIAGYDADDDEDQPEEGGPLKFQVQLQHQMAVTGASHGFLLGLIGGNEPIVKTIARNDRFIKAMLAKLEEFWGYVQRRELPPVDSSIVTGRILAKIWPKESGATAVMPADATRWSAELETAKEIIKAMKAVKVAAENQIKAAIGESTFGELPIDRNSGDVKQETMERLLKAAREIPCESLPVRYSWKQQSRAAHTVKASEFRVLMGCK